MTYLATRRPALAPSMRVPAGVFVIWLAGIVTLAAKGGFVAAPGALPVSIMIAAPLPPVLFLSAYLAFRPVRDWVAGLDMGLVVGIQVWRVIGVSILFLWWLGLLPAVFAIPAGVGDVAIGLFALFATRAVMRGTPGWRTRTGWLIAAGLTDFAVAIATGILSDPGRALGFAGQPSGALMQTLPMVLIPVFLVPVFVIAHLIAWIRLRRH